MVWWSGNLKNDMVPHLAMRNEFFGKENDLVC